MSKEEKIYYSDLTTLIDVCRESFCKDCGSEDIGAEFPKDLI